jgi:hypothetical protein
MSIDTAYRRIDCPAEQVLAFMADPQKLGLWAFGSWNTLVDETELIRGFSIKDGSQIFVRISSDENRGLIDYHVGVQPNQLVPRIFARVFPGTAFGGNDQESGLMMSALRTDDMDDARWKDLRETHAVEIGLIKAAIETGYDHRLHGSCATGD